MTIGAAIIGTGFISRIHAEAIRRAGGTVEALAASSEEKAARAAQDLNVARTFGSIEELADSPEIQVVHICTPNHVHAEYAAAALKAGKHVVCEKPLATDLMSALELLDLARTTGFIATAPYIYRFYPTVREMRGGLH